VNAELPAEDQFYEWLLSDHTDAAHERARRRLDNQLAEAQDLARLQEWLAKIDRLAQDGQPLRDSVWRLAEQARSWLIPNAEQRLAASLGEPDQAWVRRGRQDFETSQQVGNNPDYRYPARYLGAQAARQPTPPDPSTRLHDPEERPSLGERVGNALEEENSRVAFVREHAIRERAQSALERAERQRAARQPHDSRQLDRFGRARSDREEADLER
jgi:N-methylhydantoinase A/oxoprolinase/acetone carboxylase beta subunit